MFTIRHYSLDYGRTEVVETLLDRETATQHLQSRCTNDVGTDSVWYIDEDPATMQTDDE